MPATSHLIRFKQEGKTDSVIRHLEEMIALGLLAQGEQLPREPILAARLGVAPVTLRDALAVLRSRGVIETRRGRSGGSFICAPPQTSVQALYTRLRSFSALELRDFTDEHVAIAAAAAELAAQRAGPDEHDRLQMLIDALGTAGDAREQRQADARFHIEIAVAAQSVRLTHSEVRLQAELGELLWLAYGAEPDIPAMQREHSAIVDAIKANDSALAVALARAHVIKEMRKLTALRLEQIAQLE
ncbi:FadR/GntR family transcriptional regulator [Pseudomonas alkylphenolica]|uniref:FadR/GntR family transcriptional regulator n=1 Tax=Pseudomonas alkylphenolica TaxID=237609 RepID=UPI0018D6CCFA|nr:FCD domain-containing protein [Pseudomonas alkylphenolica]MBH3429941.1 FadR family transcriptional regulator [Pseudomonas alkylphenolica]